MLRSITETHRDDRPASQPNSAGFEIHPGPAERTLAQHEHEHLASLEGGPYFVQPNIAAEHLPAIGGQEYFISKLEVVGDQRLNGRRDWFVFVDEADEDFRHFKKAPPVLRATP